MRRSFWLAGFASVALLFGACGGKDEGGAAGDAPAAVQIGAEAQAKWDQLCVTCHGATGLGDGDVAVGLTVKPQSFANKEWQAGVTDDELTKVIVEGGPAVGKDAGMPPNPDLVDKPEVVADLVKKVRSFGN